MPKRGRLLREMKKIARERQNPGTAPIKTISHGTLRKREITTDPHKQNITHSERAHEQQKITRPLMNRDATFISGVSRNVHNKYSQSLVKKILSKNNLLDVGVGLGLGYISEKYIKQYIPVDLRIFHIPEFAFYPIVRYFVGNQLHIH